MLGMRPPLFVRALTDEERAQLTAGLRSSEAVVLRRCQSVLASARGERVPQIARMVGCSDKTTRQVIRRSRRKASVRWLPAPHGRIGPVPSHLRGARRASAGAVAPQLAGVRQAWQSLDLE